MSTAVFGTSGEDRSDYTREESRAIRRRSLKLLGVLLRPLKWQFVLAAIVLVVSTSMRVAGPALIAFGINEALPAVRESADWAPTIFVVAAYATIAFGGAALIGWYTVVAARLTQGILIDLRKRIFLHTQRLSLEFHESYTSGRIISRQTSDLDTIRDLLNGGLTELISGVLYGFFTLIALLLLDVQSGVILLLMGGPLYLLMRWFYLNAQRVYRESRVISARVIVKFVETMTGIRAVKAFRKERRNDEEFGKRAADYRDVNLRSIALFGIFDPGMVAISSVAIACVLLWGGVRAADDTLMVGTLLAAVLYVRNFFSPLREVAFFVNSYQSATAALEKISGVLEEVPSVPEPAAPLPLPRARGELEFSGVSFGYATDRLVLPEFSLRIPAGQTVALVGTTGAGKSTLAKLLSRFYDPSSGAITLDGIDLRELSQEDLRRAVVMVTQEAYLFSGSIAENIAIGKPDATPAEIEAAARAVGAHDFISRLPQGYDTDANKRGGRVSAGQRQLISFARAFLADPAVLLLDEATASLDMPSERLIQQALGTLLADRTAIIIAHRLSTVSIADRVLVMEHGAVIEDGTPDELISSGGKFAGLHTAWRDSLV